MVRQCKVGETLCLEDVHRSKTHKVIVTKIGRKWIYVTRVSDGEVFRFFVTNWKPDTYQYAGYVLKEAQHDQAS